MAKDSKKGGRKYLANLNNSLKPKPQTSASVVSDAPKYRGPTPAAVAAVAKFGSPSAVGFKPAYTPSAPEPDFTPEQLGTWGLFGFKPAEGSQAVMGNLLDRTQPLLAKQIGPILAERLVAAYNKGADKGVERFAYNEMFGNLDPEFFGRNSLSYINLFNPDYEFDTWQKKAQVPIDIAGSVYGGLPLQLGYAYADAKGLSEYAGPGMLGVQTAMTAWNVANNLKQSDFIGAAKAMMPLIKTLGAMGAAHVVYKTTGLNVNGLVDAVQGGALGDIWGTIAGPPPPISGLRGEFVGTPTEPWMPLLPDLADAGGLLARQRAQETATELAAQRFYVQEAIRQGVPETEPALPAPDAALQLEQQRQRTELRFARGIEEALERRRRLEDYETLERRRQYDDTFSVQNQVRQYALRVEYHRDYRGSGLNFFQFPDGLSFEQFRANPPELSHAQLDELEWDLASRRSTYEQHADFYDEPLPLDVPDTPERLRAAILDYETNAPNLGREAADAQRVRDQAALVAPATLAALDADINSHFRSIELFERRDQAYDDVDRESIRQAVFQDMAGNPAESRYVYHMSTTIEPIIREGLLSGGVSGGSPIMQHGYGNIVHVFERAGIEWGGDVTFVEGYIPQKPVATFTLQELGIDEDQLEIGARAMEEGYSWEPSLAQMGEEYTPIELARLEQREQQIVTEIMSAYSARRDQAAPNLESEAADAQRVRDQEWDEERAGEDEQYDHGAFYPEPQTAEQWRSVSNSRATADVERFNAKLLAEQEQSQHRFFLGNVNERGISRLPEARGASWQDYWNAWSADAGARIRLAARGPEVLPAAEQIASVDAETRKYAIETFLRPEEAARYDQEKQNWQEKFDAGNEHPQRPGDKRPQRPYTPEDYGESSVGTLPYPAPQTPVFRSRLVELAEAQSIKKATGEEWLRRLNNKQKVNLGEVLISGIHSVLDPETVYTKEQVLAWLKYTQMTVTATTYQDVHKDIYLRPATYVQQTRLGVTQLPIPDPNRRISPNENYFEIQLNLSTKGGLLDELPDHVDELAMAPNRPVPALTNSGDAGDFPSWHDMTPEAKTELAEKYGHKPEDLVSVDEYGTPNWMEGHGDFEQRNAIGRIGAEGLSVVYNGKRMKVMWVSEFQGATGDANVANTPPFLRFNNHGFKITMKYLMQYAYKNGYDAIAWTNGKTQEEFREADGLLELYDNIIVGSVNDIIKKTKEKVGQVMRPDSPETGWHHIFEIRTPLMEHLINTEGFTISQAPEDKEKQQRAIA